MRSANDRSNTIDDVQIDPLSLFTAVAERDYNSLFHGFVLSAAKSIVSAYPVPGRGSTRAVPAFGEKREEYFPGLSQQFGNQRGSFQSRHYANSPAKTNPSYNLLLVEILNSLLSEDITTFDVKEAALMEAVSQEGDKHSKNIGWRNSRRRKSNALSVLQQMHEDDEGAMRFSAKLLSNTRPPPNFVLHAKTPDDEHEMVDTIQEMEIDGDSNEDDDESMSGETEEDEGAPPLFNGSVGASAGSLLHLACIVDEPFILAMLLVLGAGPNSKYSAFRRLPIHEAACSNSTKCLSFLLELCKVHNYTNSQPNNRFSDKIPCAPFFPLMLLSNSKKPSSTPSSSQTQSTREVSTSSNLPSSSRSDAPNKASEYFPFLSTLRVIQLLARKISLNEITALDAANELIKKAPLSLSEKLSMTLSLSRILQASDGHGNTALHWAAFKNSSGCISILIAAGADPNARTSQTGWTPLHDAAYSDAPDATQLLLEGGANVDARANSGATPLCFAAQEDAPNAAEILLQAGADTSVRCCGHTYAATLPNHDNINNDGLPNRNRHDLLFPQAPMIASRFSGYTPLHYCAHYNAAMAAKVLMKYGAPIEIYDLAERLPIHIAVARGSSGVLRELLIAGAKVERDAQEDRHMENVEDGQSANPQSYHSEIHSRNGQRQFNDPREVTDATQLNDNFLNNAGNVARSQISSPTVSPVAAPNLITPASSPVLKQMLPREPISSAKPWNCLSQESIDECISLIEAAEGHWSPGTHRFFSPRDRRGVLELLRVGKRLEQRGTGLFLDLWPCVLSFCGRGWFEEDNGKMSPILTSKLDQKKIQNTKRIRNITDGRHTNIEEGMEDSSSSSGSHRDDDFTQFRLDGDHNF